MAVETHVDTAVQECACGQDNGSTLKANAHLRYNAGDNVSLDEQILTRALKKRKVRLIFEAATNRRAVEHPISLSPGRADSRTL